MDTWSFHNPSHKKLRMEIGSSNGTHFSWMSFSPVRHYFTPPLFSSIHSYFVQLDISPFYRFGFLVVTYIIPWKSQDAYIRTDKTQRIFEHYPLTYPIIGILFYSLILCSVLIAHLAKYLPEVIPNTTVGVEDKFDPQHLGPNASSLNYYM